MGLDRSDAKAERRERPRTVVSGHSRTACPVRRVPAHSRQPGGLNDDWALLRCLRTATATLPDLPPLLAGKYAD